MNQNDTFSFSQSTLEESVNNLEKAKVRIILVCSLFVFYSGNFLHLLHPTIYRSIYAPIFNKTKSIYCQHIQNNTISYIYNQTIIQTFSRRTSFIESRAQI